MTDRWTDERGTTWVVGAQVLWCYGRREYAEFGAWGVIESVPSPDDNRMMVRLQPAPETQKERLAVAKREEAGEDLTRLQDFHQGGRVESGLMTLPQAYTATANRFAMIADKYRKALTEYDEHGVPISK